MTKVQPLKDEMLTEMLTKDGWDAAWEFWAINHPGPHGPVQKAFTKLVNAMYPPDDV